MRIARRTRGLGWRAGVVLLAVVLAAGAVGVSRAVADSAVIPDTPDLPWADPNHQSPLEQFASKLASQIAEREVRVYCNGQTDWDNLARNVGSDGARIWGYVAPPRYWYPSLGTYADSSTHTQLATIACERLWQFAKASTKPTRCPATKTSSAVEKVKVRYRAVVPVKKRTRVKVNGKWVTRTVIVKKRVWKTRIEERQVTTTASAGSLPCYSTPADTSVTVARPDYGERGYHEFVFAIQTLAHESIHLYHGTSGRPVPKDRHEEESRAECLGMQKSAWVATQLGAAPDDAQAIASWYAKNRYPLRQTEFSDYWSEHCVSGGTLDRTPGDGIWP